MTPQSSPHQSTQQRHTAHGASHAAQRKLGFEEKRQRLILEGQHYRADILYMKQVVRSKLLGAPAPSKEAAKNPAGSGHLRMQAMSMIGQYANLRTLKMVQAAIPVVTGLLSLVSRRKKTVKPLAKGTVLLTAALGLARLLQRKRIETGARIEPTPVPHVPHVPPAGSRSARSNRPASHA